MRYNVLGSALMGPALVQLAICTSTGWKWMGVSESGAEFGTNNPGQCGVDYTFPSTQSIETLMKQGFNIFRLPFHMERMAQGTMTSTLNADFLARYTAVVNCITSAGGWAVLDPHNYGRYDNNIITSTSDFKTFWTNLAGKFANNPQVIFDTINEYHDMSESLVVELNQAAINGIRAAGATDQYIFVEGNGWTGAWSWTKVNTDMVGLTDPSDKIVYEMHQYLDSDSSGTNDQCVSSTIGVDRLSDATSWLRDNKKVGIIGEFAGGANSVCMEAVTCMLDYLRKNDDVWKGALWWGGGPWWGDYMFSFEPPNSIGYTYYGSTLEKYIP